MPRVDLYIIAAGRGSRMNADLPKALVPITDEPCLTTTLQQIGGEFRTVFVVTSVSARDQWSRYYAELKERYPDLAQLVVNLPIRSGQGDGHATLQGLLAAECIHENSVEDDVVVAWGDVFFKKAQIIEELLSTCCSGPGLIPAVWETNPYVSLMVNDSMQCMSVSFAKHGEQETAGFHDQSVFRFRRSKLKRALFDLHNSLWKGNRYMTPGGELSLLHLGHYLFNVGDPIYAYETQYPTLSFNTVEEVAAIQQEISSRWRTSTRAPPDRLSSARASK